MDAEPYAFSSSKALPGSRGTLLSPRDEDPESPETHALHVEGHGLLHLRVVHARVSFITFAFTRSRCARDLYTIQEKITVSPGLSFSWRGNVLPHFTLRSSPTHSKYSRAPWSFQIFAPS